MPDHSELEHDTLDDKKSFRQAPADKMILAPEMDKQTAQREASRAIRREEKGEQPHLHEDNPEIWEGEIE